ncbi:MAG: CPBP family glutamic-type intramembrane protease [Pirellulaceae bacterium]|nr:CPBP family glutamic-type intramembrane protease [Pirellulaceae bacterium]
MNSNPKQTNQLNPAADVPRFKAMVADLWAAIKTAPGRELAKCSGIVFAYSLAALAIGFSSGVYTVGQLDLQKYWFLPLSLFLFPSIPEEFFFRGLLIPRNAIELPWQRSVSYVIFSAFAFTIWHPLNALTVNPTAQSFFLNPFFLGIVFLLGLACGYSYLLSRSIWVPVLIHWLTVVVWVLFLGGRNLVLE